MCTQVEPSDSKAVKLQVSKTEQTPDTQTL